MARKEMTPMHIKSLEAYQEITEEGIIDKMMAIALNLVIDNPHLTTRELLDAGIQEGYYTDRDVGQIGKRLSDLKNKGEIVVSGYRKCSISNRSVSTYERNYGIVRGIRAGGKQRKVKYRPIEFPSLTDDKKTYTVIYWDDGTVQSNSMGFEVHGYDRGSIGAKILFDGVESLNIDEKKYLMRKITRRDDWEFVDKK